MDYSIFKAYDIRGTYPEQINEESAYKIGRALSILLKEKKRIIKPRVVVGRDVRSSSLALSQSFIKGLYDEGAQVLDMGFCTTPMNYFANWFLKLDASAMTTASHNPGNYNGFKIALKGVQTLPLDKDNDFFEKIAVNGTFGKTKKGGDIKNIDLTDDYLGFLKTKAKGIDFSGFKIIADSANGSAGPIFKKMADFLGMNYTLLYGDPDGSFPNHEPNPLKESTLDVLQKTIIKERADLGVGFDGDADRIVFLDQDGQQARNDFVLGVYAKYFLKKNKAKYIVSDFRVSRGVVEIIEKARGKVIKCKVGYPYLYKAMKENRAYVGSELSGHTHWKDFSYSSAEFLSIIRLIRILKEEGKSLKELIEPMNVYFPSQEINFEIEDKNKKIEEVAEAFGGGKQSRLDGLTIEYNDWWFNIRPSNTEPILRLTVEAKTKELFEEKLEKLKEIIVK